MQVSLEYDSNCIAARLIIKLDGITTIVPLEENLVRELLNYDKD